MLFQIEELEKAGAEKWGVLQRSRYFKRGEERRDITEVLQAVKGGRKEGREEEKEKEEEEEKGKSFYPGLEQS